MKKLIAVLAVILLIGAAGAEGRWIICRPDGYVNVRRNPNKGSEVVGYMDAGDRFETDGAVRNGFIRVTGFGEYGYGWVYLGYVSEDQPEAVNERYACSAKKRAACRRWADGPQVEGKAGWIYNGENVTVYYRTEAWCVTSRGFIATEWLEADPE